jgi:RING finger protein 113A
MDTAAPIFKKRGAKNIRKRPATPSENSDSFTSSEDESGVRVKRRKKNGPIVKASSREQNADRDLSTTKFSADRSVAITSANDATKQSNWSEVEGSGTANAGKLGGSDGAYKGLANQAKFIEKKPDAPDRKFGPVKAATNIRTITVTDFAPDVCRDYKVTGFCGFGDNCKFLHAREDYKQGWQLDREWESVTKGKKNLGGTLVASADRKNTAEEDDDGDDDALSNIPFACIICRESYKQPIQTRCGHYFCESCALKRYRKDPTCAACGAATNGIFNGASRLKKLLERKRQREEKRRQAAIEAGEEVSEDESDDVDDD